MLSMDEVYREYSQMVFRYLLSMTGDEDLAEELTQETFYQAVRMADRYDYSCKVTSWLCAIAKNKLREYRRKHPKTEELEIHTAQTEGPESQILSGWGKVELMKAVHRLPELTREVVYLRLFSDLSFREIGEVLEKSEDWARVTYYRGKLKLRKEWKPDA
jgi:RNA polymerase sigma factor (sigma-70 family)